MNAYVTATYLSSEHGISAIEVGVIDQPRNRNYTVNFHAEGYVSGRQQVRTKNGGMYWRPLKVIPAAVLALAEATARQSALEA